MNYLALSGNMHSLRRYFNNRVTCLDAPTWGRASWSRRHAMKVAESITEPTVLIGFSAGATACLDIAAVNYMVHRVYAHSPMDRLTKYPRCPVTLFVTIGDKTPTNQQTREIAWRYRNKLPQPELLPLHPVAPEPIRDLATWTMARRGHQFRNCLPYLPQEILR